MKKVLATILLTLSLTACSALSAFIPGMGSGTNVAANTQIGKENKQTGVIVGEVKENKVEANDIGKLSQSENAIEAAQVSIQNLPPWAIILIILGWILPSPMEIWTGTRKSISEFFSGIGNGIKFIISLFKKE